MQDMRRALPRAKLTLYVSPKTIEVGAAVRGRTRRCSAPRSALAALLTNNRCFLFPFLSLITAGRAQRAGHSSEPGPRPIAGR